MTTAAATIEETLTPPEVAKIERVDPATVRGWIRTGELTAHSVSTPGGQLRLRIRLADLKKFQELRQVIPPAPTTRKRQTKADKDFVRYSEMMK